MAERLVPELWIQIFQHLTPVELCFSVPLVSKLFNELSQENQIWSQFKCPNWNESSISLLSVIKRKYPVSEPSTQNLYKLLYVNWIKEQAQKMRLARSRDISWFPGEDEKKKIEIGVCGDAHRPYTNKTEKHEFSNMYFLTKGKPKPKLTNEISDKYATENVSHYFEDKTFNADLVEWDVFGSRVSMERIVARKINSNVFGVFWCEDAFTDASKRYIEVVKTRLQNVSPVGHLLVVDYSSVSSKVTPVTNQFKEWLNLQGIGFVEFKDIDSAMENMAKTVTRKFKDSTPKYLPPLEAFYKYAIPQKLNV